MFFAAQAAGASAALLRPGEHANDDLVSNTGGFFDTHSADMADVVPIFTSFTGYSALFIVSCLIFRMRPINHPSLKR